MHDAYTIIQFVHNHYISLKKNTENVFKISVK